MRSVLATVDYWQGRLANIETFQFIQTFQQDVMRNKSRAHSLLVINKWDKGWTRKAAERTNPFMQAVLESVSNVSYELDLKWDNSSDEQETLARNVRQEAIDELCSFVREFVPFSDQRRIRLDHIHSDEFELQVHVHLRRAQPDGASHAPRHTDARQEENSNGRKHWWIASHTISTTVIGESFLTFRRDRPRLYGLDASIYYLYKFATSHVV